MRVSGRHQAEVRGELTFDGTLLVQYGAKHPHTEVEDGEREDDANAEANAPDGTQVVLARGRQDDEEDRDRLGRAGAEEV